MIATVTEVAPAKSSHPVGVMKRTTQFYIDPTKIDRKPGFNPRFDFGEIEALATSIKYQKGVDGFGLLNDIRVTKKDGGRFELVDGDRRLTAIELLLKKGETWPEGIPAKIESKETSSIDLLIRMFTANDGKRFLPLEEAAAFKTMRESGMTIKQIMTATGRSDNTINDCLALLESDADVTDAVKSKKVSASVAKKIAVHARGDKATQKVLLKKVTDAGKDKTKKREAMRAIDAQQRSKHAKAGRTLKIRALSDDQLSSIGAGLADVLAVQLRSAGLELDADLRTLFTQDERTLMAYTFGALEALKVAAGADNDLVLKK